ncbi:tetratricopeptide repeat protein [Pelatocladus sp. BLCC-F211]|uniref:tetratricopeptide repeat protein n=1 Tax=Pelatocladus sp. BLCC-F211 TaxID=3342752 RepID=UPI0035B935C6
MASSGEEYLVNRSKKIERRKRILTWVSIVSFVGSGLFAIVPTIQEVIENPSTQPVSAESSLQQQEQGYKLVLQREPENRAALEGLVKIRLESQNFKGAVEPLEKLVKLNPERQDYKNLLEQLKKQIGNQSKK